MYAAASAAMIVLRGSLRISPSQSCNGMRDLNLSDDDITTPEKRGVYMHAFACSSIFACEPPVS